jgi:uncharacterized membrane protein
MDAYHTVLFLHFVSLFVGFGAATLMVTCLFRLRAAQTVADAAPWGMLAGQTELVFPVAILGLLATGAYMTSDVWTWDTGWIDIGIAALVVLGATGVLIAKRRAEMLKTALRANGAGPLTAKARKLTRDPALWVVTFGNPGLVLGVVWNMTQKPGTLGAIVAVVIGYAVGAAVALWFTRVPATQAATA